MAIGNDFSSLAADRRAIEGQGSSNYFNALSADRANQALAQADMSRRADMAYRYDALAQAEQDRQERMAESRRQQDFYENRDARDYAANQSRYFDQLKTAADDRKYNRDFNEKQFGLQEGDADLRKQDFEEKKSVRLSSAEQKAADVQSQYEIDLEKAKAATDQSLAQISYLSQVGKKKPEMLDKVQAGIEKQTFLIKENNPETLKEKYLRKHPDLGYDPDNGFFSRIVRAKTPEVDPTDPASGEMDWDKFDRGMQASAPAEPAYRTDADVKLAVRSGALTKEEAKRILQTQFGYN